MKRISQFICIFFLVACGGPPQDYLELSGTIANLQADSLQITGPDYRRSIPITPADSFHDTMKVDKGYYTLSAGDHQVNLFLENGYNLQITADADSFYRSLSFKGRGADNNNFIAQRVQLIEYEIGRPREYFILDDEAFKAKLDTLKKQLQSLFKGKQLDSALVAREKRINEQWLNYLISNYKQQHEIYSNIERGDPSPTFSNFKHYNGGLTSFNDLPRQLLYVMVWSTECKACIKELSSFKEIQNKYAKKGITFVGISVDSKERHKEWKAMVSQNELGGIQLHSGEGLYRPFFRDYNITEPPRYILIDENRNIIDAFAPPPSNPELRKWLEKLGL